MPDLTAGSRVLAVDTPPSVNSTVDPSFNLTNTSYATTSTGGTYSDCAVVFVAPTSGRVLVHLAARMSNTGASDGTMVCSETRTGSTIGSGTVVDGVGDRGPSHYGTTLARTGAAHFISGLTAGATYNCRMLHKVTASAGTVALRELTVEPLS
jgi:hypothetical protein